MKKATSAGWPPSAAGFSIEQIRALLALAEPSRASCAKVREIARPHLDEVRAKLADLARLESILAETVTRCSASSAPSPPSRQARDLAKRFDRLG